MLINPACKLMVLALFVFAMNFLTTLLFKHYDYFGFTENSSAIHGSIISFYAITSYKFIDYLINKISNYRDQK
ncbi:hypothetical protein C0W59_08490 [Photobacterium kishitanii]|nr:hypothetical protein C0W59_08490 [Photobacterium kishitanii]